MLIFINVNKIMVWGRIIVVLLKYNFYVQRKWNKFIFAISSSARRYFELKLDILFRDSNSWIQYNSNDIAITYDSHYYIISGITGICHHHASHLDKIYLPRCRVYLGSSIIFSSVLH